jgi:drug/metabolite transporter (DMT)-like permease
MELLWLPFSLATIFFYGVGQVFAKETRSGASSSNYLLLFSGNILAMWGIYWLLLRQPCTHEAGAWIQAAVAAGLSGGAFVFFYEALKHGKVSIVGTVAGAYAPWTVILALLFVGETMSSGEGIGVALVVSSMLLFTYSANNGEGRRTELKGILMAIGALFFWGTSAAVAKSAITEIGDTNFIGVYALVCPPIWLVYWLATTKGKFEMPAANMRMLEVSMLFIAAGGITMYLAFENGNVSIVSPITNLYPIVTILVAKMRLKESLTARQYVALAMLIVSIPLFSL